MDTIPELLNGVLDTFRAGAPYLVRLIVAALCGAAIGLERTLRQKEAGLRTHIIVALGSALIMVVSKYGFYDLLAQNNPSISFDGGRIASNVIQGISFLGSGIIIFRGTIKGLTTAAGVWATAGIGLAAGAGMYGIAVYATILMVIIEVVIHRVIPLENAKTTILTLKLKSDPEAVEEVRKILKQKHYDILSASIEQKNNLTVCTFNLKSHRGITFDDISEAFEDNENVVGISI